MIYRLFMKVSFLREMLLRVSLCRLRKFCQGRKFKRRCPSLLISFSSNISCRKEQIFDYIKNDAWSHHCSSTCAIGTDNDPMAVLDSSFRVRGVQGLRVVDASVYPKIPGTLTAVSTYMVGEKAADVILSQLANSTATASSGGLDVGLNVAVGGLDVSI
jgi:choline dehydrogenase-like flavoprotein